MKIAILGIRGIPAHYGGFETAVDETSRLLVVAGHEVTVYSRAQHMATHPAWYEGVRLRYAPRPAPLPLHTIGHTFRCARDMGREPFDVVHLYGVGNALNIPYLRRHGRRVVISVDAQDWARAKWGAVARNFLLFSARFATWTADAVIVDSRAIGALYAARFQARTHYVAYGARTRPSGGTRWLERLGLTPGGYHLFVGRLTPEKQPHELITAYRRVRSPLPLVIVGEDENRRGYDTALRGLADERVRFVGALYGEGFQELCHHCYLYLTASTIEGTSPALLQAMGQGAAVLVNGIDANRETIGDAGVAYAANDRADLIERWQALVDDPARVAALGERARARVAAYYTWSAVAAQLEAVYEHALRRRAGAAAATWLFGG